jgi:hypothetical protein
MEEPSWFKRCGTGHRPVPTLKGGIMNNEELRMNNFQFAIPVFTRTCFQFSNKNKAPHSRGYGNLVNKIFLIFDGRSNAVYVFVGEGVSMRPPAP